MPTGVPSKESIRPVERLILDRGPGIWRSAGFQVGKSVTGRCFISHRVGTLDSKKRFGPDTVSRKKMDSK